MVKLITWNIARREDAWRLLLRSEADIALLQEVAEPPPDIASKLDINPAPWWTAGAGRSRPWRSAIVKLSDRVDLKWIEARSIEDAHANDLAVSRIGTLAVAEVKQSSCDPFLVASMYAPWEKPHHSTRSSWIYADASVHRLISDLSILVGQQSGHRIIAAGDLNVLFGYGEQGSGYWASRYDTVFTRMKALGLSFVGPQVPGGRRASPWPDELPRGSANVPTFHSAQQTPATATRQLDFVFASESFSNCIRVRALNEPHDWGPSDHCRVEIQVEC